MRSLLDILEVTNFYCDGNQLLFLHRILPKQWIVLLEMAAATIPIGNAVANATELLGTRTVRCWHCIQEDLCQVCVMGTVAERKKDDENKGKAEQQAMKNKQKSEPSMVAAIFSSSQYLPQRQLIRVSRSCE